MAIPFYDLCVIGGGINGAGIARDAAGRGLSVFLAEERDLAGATSSASTKLIHGGLRYLEYFEFGLVRHALQEREVMMRIAPHIVRPLTFVLPHESGLRPAVMIRAGLFLYDRLGGATTLPPSAGVDLRAHDYGTPLIETMRKGFTYSDCWVDDARLVVLNAMDARERGAAIVTRTACTGLKAQDGNWLVSLKDSAGRRSGVTARMTVNAAGPWVRGVLETSDLIDGSVPGVRLVKGSHIVVRRLYEGPQAYILQQPDRRIVFAIPYENDFTLIGTTETPHEGDPAAAQLGGDEADYLIEAISRHFRQKIKRSDIVWSYSGVRPLLDDGREQARAVTRDYRLVRNDRHGAPLLSVFGGKITTYRHLAREAVDMLTGTKSDWTAAAPLPGGDLPDGGIDRFADGQCRRYGFLPPALVRRYARAYGTRMDRMLDGIADAAGMGRDFGGGLYEAEIRYLETEEWAMTAEDILWRRTKLGLHCPPQTVHNLEARLSADNDENGGIRPACR